MGMKSASLRNLALASLAVFVVPVRADILVPGADGSDGSFSPAANTTVDLALAPTAAWDSPGTGSGIYDPDKWAAIFKYTSALPHRGLPQRNRTTP